MSIRCLCDRVSFYLNLTSNRIELYWIKCLHSCRKFGTSSTGKGKDSESSGFVQKRTGCCSTVLSLLESYDYSNEVSGFMGSSSFMCSNSIAEIFTLQLYRPSRRFQSCRTYLIKKSCLLTSTQQKWPGYRLCKPVPDLFIYYPNPN